VRVPPKPFLDFCSRHVPLLRTLAVEAEWTDSALLDAVNRHREEGDEQPETTVRKIIELRVVVNTEPGADTFELAEPLRRLLDYIFDEAMPTTPEVIQGYVASLSTVSRRLERALADDDAVSAALALQEVNDTLRRIHRDTEETRARILNEVALFKTARRQFTVRDKFQRIVHWMQRYVEPMGDIIRVDGEMEAAFGETARVLRLAHESALTPEAVAARQLHLLRVVEKFALRVFQQCRRELQPLYDSLRRASLIAEGAALALARLQKDGVDGWVRACAPGFALVRFHHAPTDAALALAFARISEGPPPAPPIVRRPVSGLEPEGKRRHAWLESVLAAAENETPLTDILDWLTSRHPDRSTTEVLAGFTRLFFHSRFRANFHDAPPRLYRTADGELHAHPVALQRKTK
jgi:hypothetical protein